MILLPELWTRPTADTDRYRAECDKAASDPEAFAVFRQQTEIIRTMEGREPEWAAELWQFAVEKWPAARNYRKFFRRLDAIGGPQNPQEVSQGFFLTATMASFIADAAALVYCFGNLNGLHIAELGGGYGALAAIVCGTQAPGSYTIYDIPETCALQRAYLGAARTAGVKTSSFIGEVTPDMVVSNYAFSELNVDSRKEIGKRMFLKSPRGFVTWHSLTNIEGDLEFMGHAKCCSTIPGWANRHAHLQFVWGSNA